MLNSTKVIQKPGHYCLWNPTLWNPDSPSWNLESRKTDLMESKNPLRCNLESSTWDPELPTSLNPESQTITKYLTFGDKSLKSCSWKPIILQEPLVKTIGKNVLIESLSLQLMLFCFSLTVPQVSRYFSRQSSSPKSGFQTHLSLLLKKLVLPNVKEHWKKAL